jgi:tape measure domain-containing protein
MSIARLQLVLDSQPMVTSARQVAEALGRVTTAGKQAETATRGLGGAQQSAVAQATAAARAHRQQAEAIQQVAQGMGAAGVAARLLGGALGGITAVQLARQFVETADRATLLAARLRLVSVSAADAAATQAQLFRIAQQNGQSLEQLATVYTRLARAGRDAGVSQDQMVQATEAIAAAMRVSGGDTASMNAALVQLAQGFASGTLRGEELNSVLEQAPRLAEAIAAGLGVTVGELRRLGQEGELKTVPVLQALVSQLGKLKEESAALPTTVGTAWDRITTAASLFVSRLNEALGITNRIAAVLDGVADVWERIAGLTDTRGAFTRGSEFGRGLSNPELQAQIDRYRNPNALDLEASADPDRRQAILAALLREQNRRRFTRRAPITITAPPVTPRDRQRAADEAARERDQIAAYEQDLDRYAYDVMAAFERDRERTRLAPPRASAPFVTDIGFDGGALQQSLRLLDPVFKRMEAAKEAAEQIRENLTRGLQQSVATFAEGLMTDGLSSARRFAETFAGLLRRAAAEAIAAALMQRVSIGAVMSLGGGILPGAGSGAAGTGPAGATASVTAAAGTSAAFTGVAAAALVVVAAFSELQASAQRVRSANESVARLNNDARGRILRATGREAEADALDREQANRERLEVIERQRQDALRQVRESLTARGSRILRVLPGGQGAAIALARRRDAEIARINRQFEEAARLEREAQEAERGAIGGGSIGDYNAPAGLNVAAMIGDIRRATLAAPAVPGGGVGGGREGLTIVINGPVTTEAKSASEFVRELQAMAQTQYGSPAEWSRVTVMA